MQIAGTKTERGVHKNDRRGDFFGVRLRRLFCIAVSKMAWRERFRVRFIGRAIVPAGAKRKNRCRVNDALNPGIARGVEQIHRADVMHLPRARAVARVREDRPGGMNHGVAIDQRTRDCIGQKNVALADFNPLAIIGKVTEIGARTNKSADSMTALDKSAHNPRTDESVCASNERYGFFTHLQLSQSPFFTNTMPRLYTCPTYVSLSNVKSNSSVCG